MPEFILMGMNGERLRLMIEEEQILSELGKVLACEQVLTPEEKLKFDKLVREEKE